MNEKLSYEDFEFPIFVNSHPAVNVKTDKGRVTLTLSDVIKTAVISGTSFLNIGDTRCGKSRVMRDIHRTYFGGEADDGGKSNWNVARNTFSSGAYFMTIDQSKVGQGKDNLLTEARVPVERRVRALCNVVDEINLALPEVQV